MVIVRICFYLSTIFFTLALSTLTLNFLQQKNIVDPEYILAHGPVYAFMFGACLGLQLICGFGLVVEYLTATKQLANTRHR